MDGERRIGLVAGNGRFPLLFADAARKAGLGITVHTGESGPVSEMLEVVKQLRILRFMSSVYLTKTQRELIKFQHDYMLCLKKSGSQAMKAWLATETTR